VVRGGMEEVDHLSAEQLVREPPDRTSCEPA
jgi:hypothetical protein